jgi:hypothetical protein
VAKRKWMDLPLCLSLRRGRCSVSEQQQSRIPAKTSRVKSFLSIVLLMVALVRATGATFSESFSRRLPTSVADLESRRISVWDSEAQNLAVTWDSRQTNAFFYLQAAIHDFNSRAMNFQVEFTLRLR